MDDHPREPAEEPPPEVAFVRGSPRQDVVGREDERCVDPKEPVVELGRGQPLKMDDVGLASPQAHEPDGMLDELHRDTQPRALEYPRAHGIEELRTPIAVGRRRLSEAKRRRDELDLRPGAGERGCECVVVRRREGGGVGNEDAHSGLD